MYLLQYCIWTVQSGANHYILQLLNEIKCDTVRQSQVGELDMQNVTVPFADREWVTQESAESTGAREPKAHKASFLLGSG